MIYEDRDKGQESRVAIRQQSRQHFSTGSRNRTASKKQLWLSFVHKGFLCTWTANRSLSMFKARSPAAARLCLTSQRIRKLNHTGESMACSMADTSSSGSSSSSSATGSSCSSSFRRGARIASARGDGVESMAVGAEIACPCW